MRVFPLALAAGLVACGGPPSPPPAPSGPPAALTATPASPDDLEVARVNGRPVWGSCVTAQAARGASRRAALDECVGFELLAQAAADRGLATDAEVVAATRTALVSQLIAREFEDKLSTPAAFGDWWTRLAAKNRHHFDHGEYRGSAYVRIDVAETATPAEDAAAHAIADKIAAALAPERGLMASHLLEIARRIAGDGVTLKHEWVLPYQRVSQLEKTYAEALYAIPEVGRTSPAVRTPWGWDVVLWTELVPEIRPTPDALVAQMLPDVKRGYFTTWVNRVASQLGVKVNVIERNVSLLEQP